MGHQFYNGSHHQRLCTIKHYVTHSKMVHLICNKLLYQTIYHLIRNGSFNRQRFCTIKNELLIPK